MTKPPIPDSSDCNFASGAREGRRTRIFHLSLLLVISCSIAALVISAFPFSTPMPSFWSGALEFAQNGHIATVFIPDAYPAFLGVAWSLAGYAGVIVFQFALYGINVAASYFVLRRLGLVSGWAAVAAGCIAMQPELLVSIKKIWDTEITAAILLLLVASVLALLRRRINYGRAAAIGVLWGIGISVRPNFPALILPIAFVFWFRHREDGRRRVSIAGGLCLICALFSAAATNTFAHGSFYIPQNGPYNFFAGANPYTKNILLKDLNAEPSILPAMMAEGFSSQTNLEDPALRGYYMEHGFAFIRQHPGAAMELAGLKFLTLLRPYIKPYGGSAVFNPVKILASLAFPFWIFVLVLSRRAGWRAEDVTIFLFVAAYILPFILTNSDPRFRPALDVLVLTHAASRLALLIRQKAAVKSGVLHEPLKQSA